MSHNAVVLKTQLVFRRVRRVAHGVPCGRPVAGWRVDSAIGSRCRRLSQATNGHTQQPFCSSDGQRHFGEIQCLAKVGREADSKACCLHSNL